VSGKSTHDGIQSHKAPCAVKRAGIVDGVFPNQSKRFWRNGNQIDSAMIFARAHFVKVHRSRRRKLRGQGRGAGVGRGLGVGEHLPVHGVGVGVAVAVGVGLGGNVAVAVAVGVGVGVAPDCAQYLPPVFKKGRPPQTIISLPVHTAV
jgi:hypothetical protein